MTMFLGMIFLVISFQKLNGVCGVVLPSMKNQLPFYQLLLPSRILLTNIT